MVRRALWGCTGKGFQDKHFGWVIVCHLCGATFRSVWMISGVKLRERHRKAEKLSAQNPMTITKRSS